MGYIPINITKLILYAERDGQDKDRKAEQVKLLVILLAHSGDYDEYQKNSKTYFPAKLITILSKIVWRMNEGE